MSVPFTGSPLALRIFVTLRITVNVVLSVLASRFVFS
jgi:hypothetical protein